MIPLEKPIMQEAGPSARPLYGREIMSKTPLVIFLTKPVGLPRISREPMITPVILQMLSTDFPKSKYQHMLHLPALNSALLA